MFLHVGCLPVSTDRTDSNTHWPHPFSQHWLTDWLRRQKTLKLPSHWLSSPWHTSALTTDQLLCCCCGCSAAVIKMHFFRNIINAYQQLHCGYSLRNITDIYHHRVQWRHCGYLWRRPCCHLACDLAPDGRSWHASDTQYHTVDWSCNITHHQQARAPRQSSND